MHRATSSQGDCPQLRDSSCDDRLLHHLGTLNRMLGDSRLPAHVRLEADLGPDLARLLISSPAPRDRLAA